MVVGRRYLVYLVGSGTGRAIRSATPASRSSELALCLRMPCSQAGDVPHAAQAASAGRVEEFRLSSEEAIDASIDLLNPQEAATGPVVSG
jgi:hypothetical protein